MLLSGDTYQTNLDSVSKMGVRLLTKPVTAAALAKALNPSVQPK